MADRKVKATKKPSKPMGRPSSYKPEYCQAILDYFDIEPSFRGEDGKKQANDLPLLVGFAHSIGVTAATLINWTTEHKDFFEAYKVAKEMQESILVSNGLGGLYNTAFAIFTAKNILGWRDSQQIDHNHQGNVTFVIKKRGE